MDLDVKFEVCSECQFNCAYCAHAGLKALDPKYHMTMEQLELFIGATEDSGYRVNIAMHGPGEPLLWKHLTEGLKRLRQSSAVQRIVINTNGIALPNFLHVLDFTDSVRVSLYPDSGSSIIRHPKIVYNPHPVFYHKLFPAPIPCTCLCSGPMIMKDLVFQHCGPPMFDALTRMNDKRDPFSFGVRLAKNYAPVTKISGSFLECAYCWSNSNCDVLIEKHNLRGGTPAEGTNRSRPL